MPKPYKQGVCCHICGIPIPHDLVNSNHPMFGTIDHVVPISKGGKDCAANRKPAHRLCNQWKGDLEITPRIQERCISHMSMLHKNKYPKTKTIIRQKGEDQFIMLTAVRKRLSAWYAVKIGLTVQESGGIGELVHNLQSWRSFYQENKDAIWACFE